jgi:hypothetical protein
LPGEDIYIVAGEAAQEGEQSSFLFGRQVQR